MEVSATIPGFRRGRSRPIQPDAVPHYLYETDFEGRRQFLVTLFIRDRPGLLRAVLAALSGEVLRSCPDGGGSGPEVVFSVDGSLSSTRLGTFSLALIVRPEGPMNCSDEQVCSELWNSLASSITSLPGRSEEASTPEELQESLQVSNFSSRRETLFKDLRFAEYRFGCVDNGIEGASRHRLSRLTAAFASELGKLGIPISYLNFPDHLDDTAESGRVWLRIAVGVAPDIGASLNVDLVADLLSRQYGCVFAKYSPRIDAASLSDRFRTIADYSEAGGVTSPHVRENQSSGALGEMDIIFVSGPARSGFVAEMLHDEFGLNVRAGTMSVLGGYTLASWAVACGSGDSFVTEVNKRHDGFWGEVTARRASVRTAEMTKIADYLWVAWDVPDRPRVFYRILAAANRALASFGLGENVANVVYSVSRVIEPHVRCAGKVKLAVPAGFLPASADGALLRIKDEVKGDLAKDLEGRTSGAVDIDLRVMRTEPGEEPWASLGVVGLL